MLKINEEINGRYVLKESKGRGTFGQVWLAYDRATDENIAIKFYVALDNKGREEFIQEFRIAAKLSHPNLLTTKDYGEWKDHPYLTMKYCDKGSAADLVGRLKPCATDELTIWKFIYDVASGLAYLHAVKPDPIVHQDIKPDNVLIDTDGTFLITDFGISKRIRNTMRKQSTRALKAGAPAYMGPERFSNHPEPILASDIWSLGASIYELAEGELPFCGMGGSMMLKGVELPALSPGWSKNLTDLMHWCLEKETWNRAKAYQVQEIAKTVFENKFSVSVEPLIIQLKEKERISNSKKQKKNPRDTNPYNGTPEEHNGHHNKNNNVSDPPKRSRSKKPIIWGGGICVTLLGVAIMWYTSSYNTSHPKQSTTEVKVNNSSPKDSLSSNKHPIIKTERSRLKKENAVPTTITKTNKPTKEKHDEKIHPKAKETAQSGSLNLNYAIWNGGIKKGKPNGKGTMTFTSNHRIDSRDPNKRIAETGERIEGTYINGHLEEGRWYKSDGSTEYIMIGE